VKPLVLIVGLAVGLAGLGLRAAAPSGTVAEHLEDLDCSAFPVQADAQEHYRAHPGDPDLLDEDSDGLACEDFLPCPCDFPSLTSNTAAEADDSPTQTPAAAALSALGGPPDSSGPRLPLVLLATVPGLLAIAGVCLRRAINN